MRRKARSKGLEKVFVMKKQYMLLVILGSLQANLILVGKSTLYLNWHLGNSSSVLVNLISIGQREEFIVNYYLL